VWVALFALFSLIIGAGAAYGYGFYTWANHKLGENAFHTGTNKKGQPIIGGPCISGACNVLILGSDSREGLSKSQQSMFGSTSTVSGHRSDTIMVLHLDPRLKKAIVLSFPRDLWVNIPHQGYDKITSAYEGGPDRVAQTIENISGLQINHLIAVNLAGFQAVVNALGGVPICVDRPMFDSLAGLNLPKAGCYNLGGFQALAFVRARHVQGDCIPDFSRITRQQQFLRAVLAKILSKRELVHAPSLISKALAHLTVDSNLTLADLIYITKQLQGISTGNVIFRAVPGHTGTISSTGASVVFMDPVAKEIFKRMRLGKDIGVLGLTQGLTAASPAAVKVRVFDSNSTGKAGKVHSLLQRAGFDIQPTQDWDNRVKVTGPVLLYRSNEKALADVLHGFFPAMPERPVPPTSLHEIDAAVIIPAGYHGPGVSSAAPGTNQQGAGAPGGPTC
jgi:LCP family protein required for cell wall assembly